MDNEKFKKFLDLALRIVFAAILCYFVYDFIITQHEYFS